MTTSLYRIVVKTVENGYFLMEICAHLSCYIRTLQIQGREGNCIVSLPNIPNITPNISIDREDAINLLLASVAMEEIGLSHILNAEGEKLQYFLKQKPKNLCDYLTINDSVNKTLRTIVKSQIMLQLKLEDIILIDQKTSRTCHDYVEEESSSSYCHCCREESSSESDVCHRGNCPHECCGCHNEDRFHRCHSCYREEHFSRYRNCCREDCYSNSCHCCREEQPSKHRSCHCRDCSSRL